MKVNLRQKTEGFVNVCEKALAIALIAHSDTCDLDELKQGSDDRLMAYNNGEPITEDEYYGF